MSEPVPVEIHVHAGGNGRFHITAPGDDQYHGRQGIFLSDESDVLVLKIDSTGRVWLQGNPAFDNPENRGQLADALRKTADYVEQNGKLVEPEPGQS